MRSQSDAAQTRTRLAEREAIATRVVDLGFPCGLVCPACDRDPCSPKAYHVALRRLLAAAATLDAATLRVGFHGGDPFALPRSFAALLDDVRGACSARGIDFEAVATSDGTSWSIGLVRRFGKLGVRAFQVTLDGPPALHDRVRPSRHGPSFASILASLKYNRGEASVVVRTDRAVGADAVEELADILDREGLFAPPNPVSLFVAERAPYAVQARQLLEHTSGIGPAGERHRSA